MLATYRDAEESYTPLRQAVLDEVNKDLIGRSKQMGLWCKLIDQVALLQTQRWSNSAHRRVDWQWVEGYSLSALT